MGNFPHLNLGQKSISIYPKKCNLVYLCKHSLVSLVKYVKRLGSLKRIQIITFEHGFWEVKTHLTMAISFLALEYPKPGIIKKGNKHFYQGFQEWPGNLGLESLSFFADERLQRDYFYMAYSYEIVLNDLTKVTIF